VGRQRRNRLGRPVDWDVASVYLRCERGQVGVTAPKRDIQCVLVREGRARVRAKEGGSQANYVRETTASERLEAARQRHDANEPYPLRLRLARVGGGATSDRGGHGDGHVVARSQAEPLRE